MSFLRHGPFNPESDEPQINIYISFDHGGFEDAKKMSDPWFFHPDDYQKILFSMISDALYECRKGFADSFQIYSMSGEIIVNYTHPKTEVAREA